MTEPIELRFRVPCSPEHAFDVWTSRTSSWWPSSHSVSGDPGLTVTIEPRAAVESSSAPPTEVTIAFVSLEDGTEVQIVHRDWERLGAKGPDLQQRSRHGWAGVLPHFQGACSA